MNEKKRISKEESAIYEWQKWVPGFGEEGQQKLKNATVLISRCGGLGSVAAYELAAAGVGKLVIAHGGNVKSSDIHRQLLLTYDWIGKPRIESIKKKLNDLNPFVEIEGIGENVNEKNASELVGRADLVLDCAPLFQERKLMNQEAVKKGIPMVECAMYELEAQISTFLPGKTPCLECLFPEDPPAWKRDFPVFGAVSGAVACLGAMEAIKVLSGLGEPLTDKLLCFNLRDMSFFTRNILRRKNCTVCGNIP